MGREGETDYLVMELVEGETLATRLTMSRCRRNIGLALVWGADADDGGSTRVHSVVAALVARHRAAGREPQNRPGTDRDRRRLAWSARHRGTPPRSRRTAPRRAPPPPQRPAPHDRLRPTSRALSAPKPRRSTACSSTISRPSSAYTRSASSPRTARCSTFAASTVDADSTWVEHYHAARAAYGRGDIPGFRRHVLVVRDSLGDQPGVNHNLACAAALLGEPNEALRRLELYAQSGLTRDVAADSDFVALWSDDRFRRLARIIRANGDSIGTARVRHRFGDPGLLTEDLAYDPVSRSLFVTSIRRGEVIEVTREGHERALIDPHARPGWGVFAAGVDPRRRLLWTSVGATPTAEDYVTADSGRTGFVVWDLRTRKPVKRMEWPRDGRERLLRDLTIGIDGTVYASDSPTGAVRLVRPGSDSIVTLVGDGTLESPQTPALSPDGRRLYVADYSSGVGIIDLRSRQRTWMTFAPGIALQGIDGLYVRGRDLVAIQNGVRPTRVMRFRLDSTGTRVLRGAPIESGTRRLGDPTHGVVIGRSFVFLANTGWDRVGPDQRLKPDPAEPPMILEGDISGP